MAHFPANDIIKLIGDSPRHDLGGSYGPNLALSELLDGSAQDLGALELGYRSAAGDPRLRQAIAELHGVHADDVVVTVGGMHAIFLLAFILCERGDAAVITSPIFPPARGALVAVGAEVRTVQLSFDRGYQLDPADVAPLLTERTKLVSLASPQNPSGGAIPREVLREVVRTMSERCPNAYLLVDDTYREAAYGSDAIAPSALTLGPNVITVASLSKCHGAPGLRLGWAIARDAAVREQLVLGKFNTVVSSPALEEALALRVFDRYDHIIAQRRRALAECLSKTAEWVAAHDEFVEWVKPDAGAICCVRLRTAVFDDDAVQRFYAELTRAGVGVSNGTWFGEAARVFRLGFAHLPVHELELALAALGSALRSSIPSSSSFVSS